MLKLIGELCKWIDHYPQVIGKEFFVRYTMLQLIGELCEWIDHHPQVIGKYFLETLDL